jgi:heptosyltransferase III
VKQTSTSAQPEPESQRGQHWVFHRGALGDSILLWPMLRQWRSRGMTVVLVCDKEKGRLAAKELGILAEDAESARFNALWVPGAPVEPLPNAVSVVAYLGRGGEGTQAWMANARKMFPNAAIAHRSERPSRPKALRYPLPARRGAADGPAVLHIGAGAEEKRWPLDRWVKVAGLLTSGERRAGADVSPPISIRMIAGEVELEKLSQEEQRVFVGAGGAFFSTLDDLAATTLSARVFVAADSGPGHLAAQLGVPTLSLFGPGDPERWAPVGPSVKAVAPPRPSTMAWLQPETVIEGIEALIRETWHTTSTGRT